MEKQTKTLCDSTIIPYRIWNYVTNYAWETKYENIPVLKNRRIDDLSGREFWDLFQTASKEDVNTYRLK